MLEKDLDSSCSSFRESRSSWMGELFNGSRGKIEGSATICGVHATPLGCRRGAWQGIDGSGHAGPATTVRHLLKRSVAQRSLGQRWRQQRHGGVRSRNDPNLVETSWPSSSHPGEPLADRPRTAVRIGYCAQAVVAKQLSSSDQQICQANRSKPSKRDSAPGIVSTYQLRAGRLSGLVASFFVFGSSI